MLRKKKKETIIFPEDYPSNQEDNGELLTREQWEEKLRAARRLGYVGGSVRKLAHELRNPLNSIYLNLQLLEEDLKKYDDATLSKRLDVSIKEVKRLEHLLSEFLQFARTSITDLKPMDINAVIKSWVDFIRPTAEQRHIQLQCHFTPNLPPVLLDELLFRSVLMNLFLNSKDAIGENGVIIIRTFIRKRKILVTLTDTGSGLPPEKLNQVFDIFYTTKPGGSGLGLSITRRAIEDMGGTITLDSSPGHGTTAIISLPMTEGAPFHSGELTPGTEEELTHQTE
jgi:signal transduction histidine kinase